MPKARQSRFLQIAVVGKGHVKVRQRDDLLDIINKEKTIEHNACKVCGVHMWSRIESTEHPLYELDFVHR